MALETIAIIGMAAGTGVSAYGTYQSGKAAEAEAKTAAMWNEYNAQIAERNEAAALREASEGARRTRRDNKAMQGSNISLMAETGSFGGSGLDLLAYNAAQLETDLQRIFAGSTNQARQYGSQAVLDRLSGQAALQRGANARRAGGVGAVGTVLTGASQTAYMRHQFG